MAAVLTFYAQGARDGTMMGLFTETIGHTQILQPEIGKWKVEEMAYVGSFVPSNAALVVRKGAPAKTPGSDADDADQCRLHRRQFAKLSVSRVARSRSAASASTWCAAIRARRK